MANPVSIIDFSKRLSVFLAEPVGDGTWNDVFEVLKFDNPGEEADATDIDAAAGQLWGNGMDDFFQAVYQQMYQAEKIWKTADATARDGLGADDGLAAQDLAYVESLQTVWYCVSVDGPAASTWAPLASGMGMIGASAWTFDTSTVIGDPGAGGFRMDSATPASVTQIAISASNVNALDMDGFIGNLTTGAAIVIQQTDDTGKSLRFSLDSPPVDNAGWWTLPVTHQDGVGTLFDEEPCSFLFQNPPPVAASNTNALTWNFDTNTGFGDPGAGRFRMDSANPAAVTLVAVNEDTINSLQVLTVLDSLAPGVLLTMQQGSDPSNVLLFEITGFSIHPTWRQIQVDPVSFPSGIFDDGEDVEFTFITPNKTEFVNVYLFDSATGDADPGSGKFRLDNTNRQLASEMYIDNVSSESATRGDFFKTLSIGDRVEIAALNKASSHAIYEVWPTKVVDGGGYWKVPLRFIEGGGGPAFVTDDPVVVRAYRPTLNDMTLAWRFDSSTTVSDPGNGNFRLNNSLPAAATKLIIDTANVRGLTYGSMFQNLKEPDYIVIQQGNDLNSLMRYRVKAGEVVNHVTYYEIGISVENTATSGFDDSEICYFQFMSQLPATYTAWGAGPTSIPSTTRTLITDTPEAGLYVVIAAFDIELPDSSTAGDTQIWLEAGGVEVNGSRITYEEAGTDLRFSGIALGIAVVDGTQDITLEASSTAMTSTVRNRRMVCIRASVSI